MKTVALLLLLCLPLFAQDGSGTEEDPFLLDLDSLIEAGFVVTVSPMDTIIYEPASVDTFRITAKSIRVSEVVKRIGQQMRKDRIQRGAMTYTENEKFTLEDGNKTDCYESIKRVHTDTDYQSSTISLRSRHRKWEDGTLTEDETEENIEEFLPDNVVSVGMDMPFSLTEGGSYRYEIIDRILIGNNLVYKLGFESKSKFKPQIKGVVWIDFSDFAIRRMEGSMSGIMPVSIMKNVPHFLLINQKVDGHWVISEMTFEVEFHSSLPLIPDKAKMKMKFSDYEFEHGGQK
ncbi:MAG: hypothetical protein GY752_00345 [bacterium]|nr:hypothetical protein [bacterium]MCP4798760.1 hypothetical protein [bacterium]